MSTALESIACALAAAGSVFFWVVVDQIGERKMFARRAKGADFKTLLLRHLLVLPA